MRRIFALMILVASMMSNMHALNIPYATYNYDIYWHWGLINMKAAHSQISYCCENDVFEGTMSGESVAWEGRVYMVYDKLNAIFTPQNETITNIEGIYRKPKVGQDTDLNNPKNYASIDGSGKLSASSATMDAIRVTANMISLYYYAHAIDFSKKAVGEVIEIPIINQENGNETLRITYNGIRTACPGACCENVYDIVFEYCIDAETALYPVHCQISTTKLVPVYFSANIKIGNVQMIMN